jgi:hypothetical protein
MKTHNELLNMSMEHQLGYLQYLAGQVYLDKTIDEKIREDDALPMEEVGVHWYAKLANGHCSLQSMLDNPLDKMEIEIIEKIEYYQNLLEHDINL